jgi:hypothetical protein
MENVRRRELAQDRVQFRSVVTISVAETSGFTAIYLLFEGRQ